MNKSIKDTLGILGVASLLLVTGCSSHKKEKDKQAEPSISVTIAKPEIHAINGITASEQSGLNYGTISTRVMGYITKIHVKVGDRVQKGQLLVTVSDQDIRAKKAQVEANVKSAEAALKVAEKDHDRLLHYFSRKVHRQGTGKCEPAI
jgi:multidrug efflux pump subunit AcrA (membrane-fusion protein)